MLGLTNLHRIAAARGDGLRPELLELLQRANAAAAANVVSLDSYRKDGWQQSGAVPVTTPAGPLPENVVPFRTTVPQPAKKAAAPKRQAPRTSRAQRLTGRIS